MSKIEEFEKSFNTLIDLSVANVMDNAIGTIRKMKDKKTQRRLSEKFVSEVYRKCSGYIHKYYDGKEN